MTKDQEKIWRYLLEDRLATAEEVAKQTSVDLKTVRQVMGYIGTPKHVIEKEIKENRIALLQDCLLYTSPSPRD